MSINNSNTINYRIESTVHNEKLLNQTIEFLKIGKTRNQKIGKNQKQQKYRNETDIKSDVEKRDLLKETPLPAINATYSARIGLLVGNPKYKSESKPENLKPPRPRHPGRGAARPPPSATNSPAEKSRLRSDDDSKADLEFSACVRRTNGGGKSRRNRAELPGMENRRPERERVGEMTAGYHGERQTVTENVPRTAAMKLRNEKGAQTLSPLQSVDDGCDVSKWDQMGLANGDGVHVLENWNPNGPLSNGSKEGRAAANGKPSSGPVYRCIYAKDGLLEIPDGLDSARDFFSNSVKRNPGNRMLGRRQVIDGKANAYTWLTYKQVYDATLKIGSAIRSRGVNPGDKCGVYGANCPKWIIALQACANAVEFIINHAEISIAFAQESKLPSMLACLAHCTSHLITIVSFGKISENQKTAAEELGVACFSWDEFTLLGNLDDNLPVKKRNSACTIMYTSGTTGEPKGVVLSNGAFMAQVLSIDQLLRLNNDECKEDDVYFSFLPLAHIFDQTIEVYLIYRGSSIGYWQGDVKHLMEDLLLLRPTIFCGVPRVFERIHTGIMDKISGSGLLKKSLFQLAKLKNLQKGLKLEEASPLSDKLVFDKTKQGIGGRVRLMFSGAAPLPQHVEEFLRVACCSLFSQGYGLTESCAGCFTSIANVHSMMGTVGVPMPTIEARLESIPEMGYDALSSVPRGEICIRGKTLFSGYYKRPDLTKEVFVDGWFHTGDVGEWQPNGVMKIIDRKKNIFKLSQGEYVAVESIENVYSQSPLVASLRGFEMLRAIHLEPVPFDIDRDLITPTFKLKRPQLYKYYKECIGQLYAEAKENKH
ncbi:eukaryotic long-chain fatty acid CoA synthetase (LC-FACS) [Castilleja foliolosa]|uniref:Eukaryotic long-chain fatty acid CoA synthetase (LC-FACS) n=1 Tax=Castilleja foliolosa TaxID=1961234 RepID=A0ABD3E370_9LAMI